MKGGEPDQPYPANGQKKGVKPTTKQKRKEPWQRSDADSGKKTEMRMEANIRGGLLTSVMDAGKNFNTLFLWGLSVLAPEYTFEFQTIQPKGETR